MRVHLQRRRVGGGQWQSFSWSLLAIESDRGHGPAVPLRRIECRTEDADGAEIHVWQGLSLTLQRDERAAYRFNLTSRSPRLFVHCEQDEQGTMRPSLLTASQDVASAYMDGGEEDVFSCPMPAAVQCWIETFIARHGEPEILLGKSRRRQRGRRQQDADEHV